MDIIGFNSIDHYELVDISPMTNNQIIGQYSNNSIMLRDKYKKAYVFYQRHNILDVTGCGVSVNNWDITIDAGEIEINGNNHTVPLTTFTINPSTYSIIYFDINGVLVKEESSDPIGGYNCDIANDNCIMLFINAGETDIVTIEQMEPYSDYICCQHQELKPGVDPSKPEFEYGDYKWTNIEYRLNVGENPSVLYVSGEDSMYITYIRDMVSYVRKINLLDNNSLEYIFNTYTNADVRYLDNNLEDGYISKYTMGINDTSLATITDTQYFHSMIPFTKNPQIEYNTSSTYPSYSTSPLLTTPFIYGESQYINTITNDVECSVYSNSGVFVSATPTLRGMTSDISYHTEFLDVNDWDDGKYYIKFHNIQTYMVNEVMDVDDGEFFVIAKRPLHIVDDEELYAIDYTYPSKYSIINSYNGASLKILEDNQLYSIDDTIDLFEEHYIVPNKYSYTEKIIEDTQLYSIDDTIDLFEEHYIITNTFNSYIEEII